MNPEKYFEMAMQFLEVGHCEKAINYLNKSLQSYDDDKSKAICHNAIGFAHDKIMDLDEAEKNYRKAIELDPTQKLFYANLFNHLKSHPHKNKVEAVDIFLKHLHDDNNIKEREFLADLYTEASKYEEACKEYEFLISLFPKNIDLYWKNALSYNRMGDNESAINNVKKGLKIDPKNHHCNLVLGICELYSGNVDKSEKIIKGLKKDIYSKKWYLGNIEFLKGNYKDAWQKYEIRNEASQVTKHLGDMPMWDGREMKDKNLIILSEQGLGDNIMVARWLHLLKNKFKKVSFWCNPRIYETMKLLKNPIEILKEAPDKKDYDVWIPVMSIPHRLNLDENDIKSEPYIVIEDKEKKDSEKKKVGICWIGSDVHKYNRYRSIFEKDYFLLKNLIEENKDIEWYSLVKGEYEDDYKKLGVQNTIKDYSDIKETGELMKGLDLVITIDTLQAHLAGSIGVKTFLMLPNFPEWRWGLKGKKCDWYSSVELFRQKKPFDWTNVIFEIKERIKEI
jgi:tetratricopeptide (TPR) repeat protein